MASEELSFLHRHRAAILKRWKEHIRQSVSPDFFSGESLVTDDLLGALYNHILDALDQNHFHELNRTFDALVDRGYSRFIGISDVTGLLFGFIHATDAALESQAADSPAHQYLAKALGRFHTDLRKVYSERIGRQAEEILRQHRDHVLAKWRRHLPTEAVSTHFTVLGRSEVAEFVEDTFEITCDMLLGDEDAKTQILDSSGLPKTKLAAYLDKQTDYLEPRGFAISSIERAIMHVGEIAEPILFTQLHGLVSDYRKAMWVLGAAIKRLALAFSEHYNQRMMNNYYEEVSKMLHRIKNKITPAQTGLQTILPQEFYGREQEGMLLGVDDAHLLEELVSAVIDFVESAEDIEAALQGAGLAEAAGRVQAVASLVRNRRDDVDGAHSKLGLIEIVDEFIRDALEAAELSTALAKDLQEVQNDLVRREPPVWEPILINDLVRRAFEESQVDARVKGLDYVLTVDEQEAYIFGIDRQISQPFAQVINNAIKYTPAPPSNGVANGNSNGSANGAAETVDLSHHRVTVTLTVEESSVLFACQDSGIGIPEGEEELVFALCERCSNAKDFNKQGSGTGLYQDRKIVEQHNGKIWVESPGAGQGSTFYIRLPRYEVEEQIAPAAL